MATTEFVIISLSSHSILLLTTVLRWVTQSHLNTAADMTTLYFTVISCRTTISTLFTYNQTQNVEPITRHKYYFLITILQLVYE
jgi:hypothetical protein